MTQEDKQLLLKDLCMRLPYGVKVKSSRRRMIVTLSLDVMTDFHLGCIVKPFLRPMSSMTEEEKKSYNELSNDVKNYFGINAESQSCSNLVDWLNKNYFDYRELIPMGLALEAPEGMYKTE